MSEFLGEAKRYNILGFSGARGTGSLYSEHPNRCLWDICGKPSVQWALEAGLNSKYVDRVAFATESQEIKEVVETLGVTVVDRPYYQTLDLPRDYKNGAFARKKPRSRLSRVPAVFMSVEAYIEWYMEKVEDYVADIIVQLPANAPMLTTEIVDRMIEKFFEDEEALVVNCYYPIMPYVFTLNSMTDRIFPLFVQGGLDKQMYPPFFRKGMGRVEGAPSKATMGGGVEAHIIIKPEEGLDMHNAEDLFLARCYMERRLERKREEDGD